MLEYVRIDILEGIDVNKTNASKEFDIFHYCYFLDKDFQYEPNLCNGCDELIQNLILMILLLFLLKEMIIEFIIGS